MVNKNKIHTLCYFNFDQRKLCIPGLYFLYNLGELIYIGISRLPAFRVLQHYYTTDAPKKGIGPIFDQFRVIALNKTYKDERILQHYEKRWIRKFNPKLNAHTKNVFYDLSINDIKYHIDTYEQYFKGHMGWHRYINDLVLKKQENYKKYKNVRERKKRYENKFA